MPTKSILKAGRRWVRHGSALLRTPFLNEWSGKREEARRDRDRLREKILATHQAGRPHKTLLTAAQTAGGIKEILPVAEITCPLVTETEAALLRAGPLPESAPHDCARGLPPF